MLFNLQFQSTAGVMEYKIEIFHGQIFDILYFAMLHTFITLLVMLYKDTLGVKKARPSRKHQLLLFSACD